LTCHNQSDCHRLAIGANATAGLDQADDIVHDVDSEQVNGTIQPETETDVTESEDEDAVIAGSRKRIVVHEHGAKNVITVVEKDVVISDDEDGIILPKRKRPVMESDDESEINLDQHAIKRKRKLVIVVDLGSELE
jgi:hypothetical protein